MTTLAININLVFISYGTDAENNKELKRFRDGIPIKIDFCHEWVIDNSIEATYMINRML